jgi:hypothetical protein
LKLWQLRNIPEHVFPLITISVIYFNKISVKNQVLFYKTEEKILCTSLESRGRFLTGYMKQPPQKGRQLFMVYCEWELGGYGSTQPSLAMIASAISRVPTAVGSFRSAFIS